MTLKKNTDSWQFYNYFWQPLIILLQRTQNYIRKKMYTMVTKVFSSLESTISFTLEPL